MRIALIQTYPIYHDLITTDEWVKKDSRDLILPAILAENGHEVELWAVGTEERQIKLDRYLLRVFKADQVDEKTKFHISTDLVEHARRYMPDACILKGVDGGIGNKLIKAFLLPNAVPYAFVIGGEYYSRYVPKASCLLIESSRQRTLLSSPRKPWRRKVFSRQLVRLPKTVNLDRFKPSEEDEKTWDVITTGRLISRYKDYSALTLLTKNVRVAVLGGGPHLSYLKDKYPDIEWLGYVEHSEVASYLQRSRLFVYTSTRDYYPRSISEATSCGLPSVVLAGNISDDVVPSDRGIISLKKNLRQNVLTLLNDKARLGAMSDACREFAENEFPQSNLRGPLRTVLDILVSDIESRR